MKLEHFPQVEQLVLERMRLIGQRDEGRYVLAIDGRPQAPALMEQLMPALRLVLTSRIDEIDHRLIELGVDVD
jgi:hypothetical protein